jgi:transposase
MSRRARKQDLEMSGNSLGVVLSSGGLAAAERSGGSPPGEPQRSAAAAKAGADSGAVSRPDPEVAAKAKRRTYTTEYKQRILEEAEAAAASRGAVGALLRREDLYSSLLATWRRERASGIREALTARRRGPKSKHNPFRRRSAAATPSGRPIDRKTPQSGDHHRRAKKVAALLGNPLPDVDPDEKS